MEKAAVVVGSVVVVGAAVGLVAALLISRSAWWQYRQLLKKAKDRK